MHGIKLSREWPSVVGVGVADRNQSASLGSAGKRFGRIRTKKKHGWPPATEVSKLHLYFVSYINFV